MLFECATGKPPRLNANQGNKTDSWDDAELAELYSAVPLSLRTVLDWMLAVAPAQRPDDAAKLSTELASVAETLPAAGQGSQPSPRNRTLSGNEQRVAAVLVISGLSQAFSDGEGQARESMLRELLAAHGARAERTADGLTTIAFTGLGIPADQAAQAARLALRLKGVFPESSLGMSTSRAESGGGLSLQEVAGKAARLLAATPAGRSTSMAPPPVWSRLASSSSPFRMKPGACSSRRAFAGCRAP